MSFKNNINSLLILLVIFMLTSCGPTKNIVYFQDEPLSNAVINTNDTELTYKVGDMLTINVSGLDPDAVRPFNLPVASFSTQTNAQQNNTRMQSYLINNDGTIQFPVLGALQMKGLTRTQATDMLTKKLEEYLKNPIVNIRLINFSITVLGEVNRPGTYTISDERITLSEALGYAGDLTIYGKRNNILLIRELDGEKRYAKLDLTSVNIVNSKNYYLSQNDVIYVEPNKSKARTSNYTQNNAVLISAVGTLATIIAILIR